MRTWDDSAFVAVELEPSSSPTGGTRPFAPVDPGVLAATLLALPNPVPTLQHWLEVVPLPELARVLHAVVQQLDRGAPSRALTVRHLDMQMGAYAIRLDLLLLPTIFVPEAWSSTFLAGLLQRPFREYAGKRLIELGTGSGWISPVLLCLTRLERAVGLDLNPDAVLVSRLNAVLNGFDRQGAELPDRLAARFDATVSDLFDPWRVTGLSADLIIGCLPQVIVPSDDDVVDDGVGLGLNARALREALSILSPGGSVILNLAGRPGVEALRRMFERYGFVSKTLWQSRVEQAPDTDIALLAALEDRHGQPFDFYFDRRSAKLVSARSALEARRAGRPVFHDLYVIEGKPRHS